MKKKISILSLVLLLVLCFSGCGSKAKDTTQYDQETLQGYSDMLIQSFSAMSEDELDRFQDMSELELNMTLLQSGLPIEGSNFLTMIESWEAAIKECGELVSIEDYKLDGDEKGATLTLESVFADRNSTIVFEFDEKMNMESMTVNAEYSTSEILKKAGLNTILGMGTVFAVLIFISFIISLFKFIPMLEQKSKKSKDAASETTITEVETVAVATDNNEELVAVIAAAIAAAESTSTDDFIVRSIKRRKTNKWN